MRRVDVFHIGPQKAASTWAYTCLKEHPQVACGPEDDVYYFDLNYYRGRDWYASRFAHASPDQVLVDFTCTYIRCPWVPERMVDENPEGRIVLCLRDPVERAFSHYWHEKKRGRIAYEFSEVLSNYDCFASWIETGFYARHIERFLRFFPRERILCQQYDHLKADAPSFLRQILEFIGVDPDFEPPALRHRVNVAGFRQTRSNTAVNKVRRGLQEVGLGRIVTGVERRFPALTGKAEYLEGIDPELEATLRRICEPEIARTEELLKIDLSHWRRGREGSSEG